MKSIFSVLSISVGDTGIILNWTSKEKVLNLQNLFILQGLEIAYLSHWRQNSQSILMLWNMYSSFPSVGFALRYIFRKKTQQEWLNMRRETEYRGTSFKLIDNAFPKYIKSYLVLNQSIKQRKPHFTFTQVCSGVPCTPRDQVSTQLTQCASAGSLSGDFHPLQQFYITPVSVPSTLINLTAAFSSIQPSLF